MGARQRLNSLYFLGAVVGAVFAGAASGSWAVFLGVALVLLGLLVHNGDIRPMPPSRRERRPSRHR
ncbi:hypothetical protein [Planctomicrobium piriforme]|uniref:Uncharacterized protein n=1 Tax=Planctomicrobium piriforme TaxID=1576369 RepID=A0A1I3S1X3_9PLAN|nr:hypothetical protein [Planctomicrobium piriforme]SFJ51526.1 hypothetical protein SAMN05421753_12248 [Planctomicrobium piriforme]